MDWLKTIINRQKQRVGLRWEANVLSFCTLTLTGDDRQFTRVERVAIDDASPEKALVELVKQHDIKQAEAYWVLPPEHYRLLTIERPPVPEAELAQAIRWQVKDLIDFEVEQAVIQHFAYPKGLPGSHQIYVVVTHRKTIEQLVALTREMGLELKAIDISELALGNVIRPQLQAGQNIAFIGEHPEGLSVNCYFGDEFVFTRWLPDVYLPRNKSDLDFTLDLDTDPQAENDRLLLEIQRTLDYYEGQISRQAVTRILIPSIGSETDNLKELFSSNLGLPVDVLNLQPFCHWVEPVNELNMHANLSVVGAVLRDQDLIQGSGAAAMDRVEAVDAAD